MKRELVKPIALYATEEELKLIQLIKDYHKRPTTSDMLRVLIHQEAEKILAKNNHGRIITKT